MNVLKRLNTQAATAPQSQSRGDAAVVLLGFGLLAAAAYIVHLHQELAVARQRGDMYRDIAASLDREQAP